MRPLRFAAKGLPEGLTLDADRGILGGRVPEKKGNYAMIFTAKNARGEAARAFTLVVGERLALTPPVGWNSWGGHMLYISDAIMRKAADVIVEKGLADVGFQYVSTDDCWMRISPENYAARTPAKEAACGIQLRGPHRRRARCRRQHPAQPALSRYEGADGLYPRLRSAGRPVQLARAVHLPELRRLVRT